MTRAADVTWLLDECRDYLADPEGHLQRHTANDPAHIQHVAAAVEALDQLVAENRRLLAFVDVVSGALAATVTGHRGVVSAEQN